MASRRELRHLIIRRRNDRIASDRDDRLPVRLWMHPDTLSDLLTDDDAAERWVLDFEGREFMGVPVVERPDMAVGLVDVDWPAPFTEADRV